MFRVCLEFRVYVGFRIDGITRWVFGSSVGVSKLIGSIVGTFHYLDLLGVIKLEACEDVQETWPERCKLQYQ